MAELPATWQIAADYSPIYAADVRRVIGSVLPPGFLVRSIGSVTAAIVEALYRQPAEDWPVHRL